MCELKLSDEYIDKFLHQLKQDYKTARFKSEVVFDTLLLPEILINLVDKELGIKAEYITKEFPIYNKRGCGETDNIKYDNKSFAVDYLIKGKDKFFYLVELKTDDGSFKPKQLARYEHVIEKFDFNALFKDYWEMYYASKYFNQAQEMLKNLGVVIEDKKDLYKTGKLWKEKLENLEISNSNLDVIYIVPDKSKCDPNKLGLCIELNKLSPNGYSDLTSDFIKIWRSCNGLPMSEI